MFLVAGLNQSVRLVPSGRKFESLKISVFLYAAGIIAPVTGFGGPEKNLV